MWIAALGLYLAFSVVTASAQGQSGSEHSTGRTVLPPEQEGMMQPQGRTGPINTGTGGAPAESPQGQSPPQMQAAPEGSDKTIVGAPKK